MNKQLKTILTIILVALLAQFFWVESIIWGSTSWGNPFALPLLAINGLAIGAYCLPFWQSSKLPKTALNQKLKAFGLLYGLTFIVFMLAIVFLTLLNRAVFEKDNATLVSSFCILLGLLYLVITFIHRISQNIWGAIEAKQKLLLLLGIVFCIGISELQIFFFQGKGTIYDNGFADAVKMGYPFFWIIIIMALVGRITEQKMLQANYKQK